MHTHTCTHIHTVPEWLICQSMLPFPAVIPPLFPARFLWTETGACKIGVYCLHVLSLFHCVCVRLCNQSLFTTFCTPYQCSTAETQNITLRYPISLFYISAILHSEFSWRVHFTACWSDDGSWERGGCWKGPWLVKPLGRNKVTKDEQNAEEGIVADICMLH